MKSSTIWMWSLVSALVVAPLALAEGGHGGSRATQGSSSSSSSNSGTSSDSSSGLGPAGSAENNSAGSPSQKYPSIKMTKVKAFDDVFTKAKKIETTLDSNNKAMADANKQLNVALGLATNAPLKTALEDLRTKSGDAINLALQGTSLKLVAGKSLPSNVQKGLVAGNKSIKACETTLAQTKNLGPQSQALVQASAEFPKQIPKLPTMGVKLVDVPKISEILINNTQAIASFPDRVKYTGELAAGMLTDVKAVFPMAQK